MITSGRWHCAGALAMQSQSINNTHTSSVIMTHSVLQRRNSAG
jgi:hypothetical protein